MFPVVKYVKRGFFHELSALHVALTMAKTEFGKPFRRTSTTPTEESLVFSAWAANRVMDPANE